MVTFGLDESDRFTITGYQQQRPFSSFLPGIAGRSGTPLWAFYVNRGQAMASFGVESKDSPIMEFQPANKAYQVAPYTGFRTFLKLGRGSQVQPVTPYEPFSPWDGGAVPKRNGQTKSLSYNIGDGPNQKMVIGANELELGQTKGLSYNIGDGPNQKMVIGANELELGQTKSLSYNIGDGPNQKMVIGANELELEETSPEHGLSTRVLYFILPGESFAGLVRKVTFTNLEETPLTLDILDGMPAVIPYGVNNFLLKELGRTVESWMEVFNHEAGIPFYRVRASVVDKVEVETFQAGHFALALVGQTRLPVMVDPVAVFGQDTSFYNPAGFYQQSMQELLSARQITCGRTPCAFFAHQAALEAGESVTIYSLYGHIGGQEILQRHTQRITRPDYFDGKFLEAKDLAQDQTDYVDTHTSQRMFDAYCRQNFLDNVLRGGWPVLLGNPQKPHVYPIYSRKHGDLERDYNPFFIAAEPYSQGEGSYRDVNQNRRDNVRLCPASGDFDIRTFMSLIQTDGYNPRTVKGSTFSLAPEKLAVVLEQVRQPDKLRPLLAQPFTPGRLLKQITDNDIELLLPPEEFLACALAEAEQRLDADFHEGYWIDHWEYNLDLIDSYLAVYPDRQDELLFGGAGLPFFDSPAFVQPRDKKYVLANGTPKHIGSLIDDKEKAALIASRAGQPNWARTQHGRGAIYTTTLFVKLALTALLKFATLDPWGMGIEMEASRPGWYDALNGLPALFGSGLSETYELQRWLNFLRQAIRTHGSGEIRLPVEATALLEEVTRLLKVYNSHPDPAGEFTYWDAVSTAREAYRESTRLGLDGAEKAISLDEIDPILTAFQAKVAAGITQALELNHGLPPTYFTFQVDDYAMLSEVDPQGRPYIRAKSFTPQVLPLFLEGPVHAYKILQDVKTARELYRQVKDSPLFDRKLRMYKVNASLADQPHTIGRARAFPPGWLENESIWLHMEYKYLLEVLKAGLYEEFCEDMQHALVPFLDPQTYGRSTLENSSFLVSSAHPDASLHGAGFVARLSGSTAEFISIWNVMMAGKQPFSMQDRQLCLAFRPALPGWLFKEDGTLSFRFLGSCTVTYHNPERLDTFKEDFQPGRMLLQTTRGKTFEIDGDTLRPPYAARVRQGEVSSIDVYSRPINSKERSAG
jgi:hypothetical protein